LSYRRDLVSARRRTNRPGRPQKFGGPDRGQGPAPSANPKLVGRSSTVPPDRAIGPVQSRSSRSG